MKVMRLRHAKIFVILLVVANLILLYFSWKSPVWKRISVNLLPNGRLSQLLLPDQEMANANGPKDKLKNNYKHVRKSITIVFRSVYSFDNDLRASIDSILEIIPNMPILILQDAMPYPPILEAANETASRESSVRIVNLSFDIEKTRDELNPLAAIHTKYVLLMPDSVRLTSKNLLQKILREMNSSMKTNAKTGKRDLIAPDEVVRRLIMIPFAGNMKTFSSCVEIQLDLANWTVQYEATNVSDKCDLFIQKHAVLLDVGVLKELIDPFANPFPEMFYMQVKNAKLSKTLFPQTLQDGRRLFASYHTKQRRLEIRRRDFREMYKKLQIKRIVTRSYKIVPKSDNNNINSQNDDTIVKTTNTNHQRNILLDAQFSSSNFSLPLITDIELIGCERSTKSCIGPVYDNRPFYIYINKHTPPCCIDKLKNTFLHVLEEFENVGIRYWLDNYALSTAIETGQLSVDAYDIDVSFNVNDLERSNALKKSQTKPFVDNDGFYWIKATDGHYYRLQFSKINQIGVNLLPFEIVGNEVRPSGFFGWKAKDFSVDYLHPMSTVLFLGKTVNCPNNVRDFLDAKNIRKSIKDIKDDGD